MRLLLHICCAPCANRCIDVLREEGHDLTGFWYNPNIHPFTEYRMRRNTVQEYARLVGMPLELRDEYALRPFIRTVAKDIQNRCVKCYSMRLFAAAQFAAQQGYEGFTSSLFISPYQKHDLLIQTAREAAETWGVEFVYRDFRPEFRAGQDRARALGLYMQKYCGCVFSEEERYRKPKQIIP